MTVPSRAATEFKEFLVAAVGAAQVRVGGRSAADVVVLSEFGTILTETPGPDDGSIPDSLTIRTPVVKNISASHPNLLVTLNALNSPGGLNRWVYREADAALYLESTLLVGNPTDENLLRLGSFLLRSQVSDARAKLFSGLHDLLDAQPAVLLDADSEILWNADDYTIACFNEVEVLPFHERLDLWESRWDRSRRVLPVPDYAPYQGPGWLGLPATNGWVVQLPWTSVALDYGVIEIRTDHLLNDSEGETLLLDINYHAESSMWGAGLEMFVELPVGSLVDGSRVASSGRRFGGSPAGGQCVRIYRLRGCRLYRSNYRTARAASAGPGLDAPAETP